MLYGPVDESESLAVAGRAGVSVGAGEDDGSRAGNNETSSGTRSIG